MSVKRMLAGARIGATLADLAGLGPEGKAVATGLGALAGASENEKPRRKTRKAKTAPKAKAKKPAAKKKSKLTRAERSVINKKRHAEEREKARKKS